jgi:hypothetical protein
VGGGEPGAAAVFDEGLGAGGGEVKAAAMVDPDGAAGDAEGLAPPSSSQASAAAMLRSGSSKPSALTPDGTG